jgi:ubiquinone/menaquinone biosynthesis C-methylase UbiE
MIQQISNIYSRLLGNPMALNRRLRIRVLRPLLQKLVRGNVLDVGCGDGSFTQLLMINRARVYAVDTLNWGILQRLPKLVFQRADGKHLPYADESYDFVFCSDVLEHIQECETVVAEIARILRPGGLCLISTVNGYWTSPWKLRRVFLHHFPPRLASWLMGRFYQSDEALHRNVLGHVRYDLEPSQVSDWLQESSVEIVNTVLYCRTFGSLLMEIYFSFNETLRYIVYPILLAFLWLDQRINTGKAWQYALVGQKTKAQ